MPISVLFVTAMYPHPEQPANGAFVMQQAKQLQALGNHVEVYHFRSYRSRWTYVKAAVDVFHLTRKNRYDVVHAHYGVTGLAALLRWRAPLVVTLHGSDVLIGRVEPMISRIVCHWADATIAVSERIASRIPGEVIPCGVDLEAFQPQSRHVARERLGLRHNKKYILFPFDPGRTVKRFDIASAAVRCLATDDSAVELLIASKVPNSEMPWYYSAADAMILCSDSEGSPTAVKEALACNLPVVSTDVGDITQILKDIDGVEICEQSSAALAAGLKNVLQRPEAFAFNGRSAMSRYDQVNITKALLGVYARAIERHQGRREAAASSSTARRSRCWTAQSKLL